MDLTVALTGLLPFAVLVAAIVAWPLSRVLLVFYRRAVERGMQSLSAAQPAAATAPAARRPPPAAPLVLRALDAHPPARAHPDLQRSLQGVWQPAWAQVIGGLGFALVMLAGQLASERSGPFHVAQLVYLLPVYLWPTLLAVMLVSMIDPRQRRRWLLAYAALIAGVSLVAWARNPDLGLLGVPLVWLLANGPATLMLLGYLHRSIRAVGPLVLPFMVVVALSSQLLVLLIGSFDTLTMGLVVVGQHLGLGATELFIGTMVVGLLLGMPLCWPFLQHLGQAYQRKALSEQSITLDAMWLMFGFVQSVGLVFEGPAWGLIGVAAFGTYALLRRAVWALQARRRETAVPRQLLLLRVFALGSRSEAFFHKLRQYWAPVGPVTMIAGPDLVTTTVEPHEFLAFLGGSLQQHFVRDDADLNHRLLHLDRSPDPDGRYRIGEFFCHGNTWEQTMVRLACSSDAILMDLRGFGDNNAGCRTELGYLLDRVDLERVVFLVDATTRMSELESNVQTLWAQLALDSPNRRVAAPALRLFTLEHQSREMLQSLMTHLLVPPAAHADAPAAAGPLTRAESVTPVARQA